MDVAQLWNSVTWSAAVAVVVYLVIGKILDRIIRP